MKIKLLIIFLTLITNRLYSQEEHYYYYQGEKINLEVDENKIDIWTDINFDINSLNDIGLEKIYYQEGKKRDYKWVTLEFKTNLKKEERNSKIKSILELNEVKNYSHYFKRKNTKSIGTSNNFYVKLKKEQDYEILRKIAEENTIEIIHRNRFMPLWYKLEVKSKKTSIEMSNLLYETNLFADVDPGFIFNFDENCTNDSDFNQLWGLNNSQNPNIDINACDAWNITEGDGINVAVLDQGVSITHNDLSANISNLSFDTQNGSSPSVFTNGKNHGTHVAGTIAAVKDNGLQVVGVAPQSKIMSISHTLAITPNISEELADGINWAWQNGAHIINNSWGDQGGQFFNQLHSVLLENAINNALNNGRNGLGTILVFAAGNFSPVIDYPANSNPNILTVGSITQAGNRSNFSGFGNQLDVVAPGSNILSTIPNQNTASFNGTSMAAPHVSGVAALILSVNPNLTAQEVRNIIESTAQKVGGYNYQNTLGRPNGTWDDEMGYGLVDAFAAVQAAMPQPAITGASLVCTSPNQTYALTNATGSATWQVSSNLQIISSSNTSITVSPVNSNVNGSGFVKAITTTASVQKDVWIGKPKINTPLPGPDPTPSTSFCQSYNYETQNYVIVDTEGVPSPSSNSDWEWVAISNNFYYNTYKNRINFIPHQVGPLVFKVRAKNICGWSDYAFFQYNVVNCGSGGGEQQFSVYPNPTSDFVNIAYSIENETNNTDTPKYKGVSERITQLRLYDFSGNLLIDKKQGSFEKLNISEIKKGIYFLEIFSDDTKEIHRIAIDR